MRTSTTTAATNQNTNKEKYKSETKVNQKNQLQQQQKVTKEPIIYYSSDKTRPQKLQQQRQRVKIKKFQRKWKEKPRFNNSDPKPKEQQ